MLNHNQICLDSQNVRESCGMWIMLKKTAGRWIILWGYWFSANILTVHVDAHCGNKGLYRARFPCAVCTITGEHDHVLRGPFNNYISRRYRTDADSVIECTFTMHAGYRRLLNVWLFSQLIVLCKYGHSVKNTILYLIFKHCCCGCVYCAIISAVKNAKAIVVK